MSNQNKQNMLYSGVGLLVIITILSVPRTISKSAADQLAGAARVSQALATTTNAVSNVVGPTNPFESFTLKAKAAYVFDITQQKVLFAKNEDQSLPLASLTKIMMAITAADTAPSSTVVTISTEDLQAGGDTGLYGNEKWTLADLLKFTLIVSSNDGAAAVGRTLGMPGQQDQSTTSRKMFVEKMNQKAEALGLNHTHFSNETGLDLNPRQAGAYGSAKNVAELLYYAMAHYRPIIEPTRYSSYTFTSLSNLKHEAKNTDVLSSKISGLIASKTGYTDLAGGNLAVAFDAGIQHPVIVVVLGSTYEGRFTDVKNLVHAVITSNAEQKP